MNRVKTKIDVVYNENVKRDIVIGHISDIHFNINTKVKDLNKVIKEMENIKPDYIMITGDLIDVPKITENKVKIKELVVFLTDLGKIAKVLLCIGNHDVLIEPDFKFFNKLDDLNNIYVLNNSSYKDDNIFVSGFTLPNDYYYNITGRESVDIFLDYLDNNSKLIHRLPKDRVKIGLIHSPIRLNNALILKKLHEYDLLLTGHTHGGMVPGFLDFMFPKNMGIVSPCKGFFPDVARGRMDNKVEDKVITVIINGAITKMSYRSGVIFRNLNFLYNKSANKVIIRRRRGIKYEN